MIQRESAVATSGPAHVRNFCIIAHIDHGKTTLSDRLLEFTKTVQRREMEEQLLDAMDLERERGITIKMHPVTLTYTARDGQTYELNFIDTPGHVDFSSEVSRSLAACEGALLVIDAAQGIEAQTLANYHLALAQDLTIIPVINKIDLPAADVERVKHEIEELLVIEGSDAIPASAKEGIGIEEILEAIVQRVPPPRGSDEKLRGLVFDAQFDTYRGVVAYVRIVDGELKAGSRFMSMAHRRVYEATEVGVFKPEMRKTESLAVGNVGYVIANIKSLGDMDVGDTITLADDPAAVALPGYKPIVPMVYCGLYPNEGVEVSDLRDALEKLALNDSALHFEPESSIALGFGFRCGFLGLLHMEIVQERLERTYNLDLIATSPSVVFRVTLTDGTVENIDNPAKLPARDKIVGDGGAVRQSDGDHAAGIRRRDHGAHAEPARDAFEHGISGRRPRNPELRDAADRSHRGLLRPAQVAHEGVRVAGLRGDRLSRRRSGEARDPAQRRAGRCAVVHRVA